MIEETIISKKIIKPDKCILVFGIPTSKKEFEEKLNQFRYGYSHLFQAHYGENAFDQYKKQFLDGFVNTKRVLTDLGVGICPKLGLKAFGELCQSKRYDVIIVFSHSEKETEEIEFHDGFANSSLILERIPETFSGIIDLSTCPLPPVVQEIRNKRVNCIIRSNNKYSKPKPYFWLNFYKILFGYLKQVDKTYLHAFKDVVKEFSKKKRKGKISL